MSTATELTAALGPTRIPANWTWVIEHLRARGVEIEIVTAEP